MPPRIHISLNNEQIAKYDLQTGNFIIINPKLSFTTQYFTVMG